MLATIFLGQTFVFFFLTEEVHGQCSSLVCLPDSYNAMDLPPTSEGPVIVSTTIFLLDIFEVHPETFTLDLSMSIKLVWQDSRIELASGYVNVDQRFMEKVWKPDTYLARNRAQKRVLRAKVIWL